MKRMEGGISSVKLWVKKLFVATVAALTLGMYVPSIDLEVSADVDNKDIEENKDTIERARIVHTLDEVEDLSSTIVTSKEELIEQATSRTLEKIGPRTIKPIEREVMNEVIPHIETVVEAIVDKYDPDQSFRLSLIEHKTPGYGEKIFDVYDETEEKIVAKFHVRRDNKPLDGYYFNFHYHLEDDQFDYHYPIAEVCYGKNTPPKWMS